MGSEIEGPKRRQPRGKRRPRIDTGDLITLRVSPEEKQRLRDEAGEGGISAYVRRRLFAGGARSRRGLRSIAALHVLGRRLQALVELPEVDRVKVAVVLDEIRTAVRELATKADELEEEPGT